MMRKRLHHLIQNKECATIRDKDKADALEKIEQLNEELMEAQQQ